jgi:hypothetical protein
MKRIRTADRARAPLGDHVGDPVRGVGGHVRDQLAAFGAQRIEEAAQYVVSRTSTRPQVDSAGVLADGYDLTAAG